MTFIRDIADWMEKFKLAWLAKDIDGVLELFTDDVEYWETPFKIMTKDVDLKSVWEEVLPLQNMQLDYEVVSFDIKHNTYGVRWYFSHLGGESAGAYLIKLNEQGLCTFFYHSAQSKN